MPDDVYVMLIIERGCVCVCVCVCVHVKLLQLMKLQLCLYMFESTWNPWQGAQILPVLSDEGNIGCLPLPISALTESKMSWRLPKRLKTNKVDFSLITFVHMSEHKDKTTYT